MPKLVAVAHGESLVLSGMESCAGGRDSLSSICPIVPRMYDVRARVDLVMALVSKQGCSSFGVANECYLVDPASSHMLVSKIKPCMCKYELIQTVKLRMAH